MELRHLRYFVILSEELHFGHAAKRLYMAQPPLSQRIIDLEHELGVPLFLRRRTGLELTEAGALLLEHARDLIERADRTITVMRRIRPGASALLRVGIPPDTNPMTIKGLFDSFHASVPDAVLQLHELTTSEQVIGLHSDEIDVGVLRHPFSIKGLESGRIASRPLGVIMKESKLENSESTSLSELSESSLVIFPRVMHPLLYDYLLTTCKEAGFSPKRILHARNPNFAHGLILAGEAVHLNEKPWAGLPNGLIWRKITGEPLHWRTSVCWLEGQNSELISSFEHAMLAGLQVGGHELENTTI